MPIKLNSTGGGSVTLDIPATGSTFTHTFPAETGTVITTGTSSGISASALTTGRAPTSAMPAGSIIQVQQATYNTRQVYGNYDGWQVISGWSLSITPSSSSSKILLSCHFAHSTNGDTSTAFRWVRNGSYLSYGTGYDTNRDAHFKGACTNSAYWQFMVSHELLDSPATTSALTYQLYFRPYDGGRTWYFNGCSDSSGNADRAYCIATMTAKEIAQ